MGKRLWVTRSFAGPRLVIRRAPRKDNVAFMEINANAILAIADPSRDAMRIGAPASHAGGFAPWRFKNTHRRIRNAAIALSKQASKIGHVP